MGLRGPLGPPGAVGRDVSRFLFVAHLALIEAGYLHVPSVPNTAKKLITSPRQRHSLVLQLAMMTTSEQLWGQCVAN